MQTIFTAPGGNCFSACVASILELPLEQVPHFFAEARSTNEVWTQADWDQVLRFANDQGHYAHWVDPDEEPGLVRLLVGSGLPYVAFGPSPRGPYGHCVVMRGEQLVHDPRPDGTGLAGKPWLFIVFDAQV